MAVRALGDLEYWNRVLFKKVQVLKIEKQVQF